MTTVLGFKNSDLTLNIAQIDKAPVVEVEREVHHHLILDFSYSMAGQMNQLASDSKNIIRNSVRSGDKVSLLYFSGRGQFGYILKDFQVDNIEHIKTLDSIIDKKFRPIGSTGMLEPIEEAVKHISSDMVNSLMFMSDGYDNCWNTSQILNAIDKAGEVFDNISIVEYGWHANRNLLTQMARQVGANYVFAEDVVNFSRIMDSFIKSKPVSVPKIELTVGETECGIVYDYHEDIIYEVRNGSVMVPENSEKIVWLSKGKGGSTLNPNHHEAELYGLMGAFSTMMRPDIVYNILSELGDVAFTNQFVNCFGKQSYTEFKENCDKARTDENARFLEGRNFDMIPAEDAFTVLDLIDLLMVEGCKLLVGSEDFSYNRIGQATETDSNIDKVELAHLSGLLSTARTAKELRDIQERIAALTANAIDLEFTRTTDEVEFSNLTFNSTRPNISGLVCLEGTVNIGPNKFGLPEELPTHVFRNYTIVRDGIVNMEVLPVSIPRRIFTILEDNGVKMTVKGKGRETVVANILLKGLPIINRSMVKNVSAKTLFEKELALMEQKARAKVYKVLQDRIAPKAKSKNLVEAYGGPASEWLAENFITDSGFSPKVVKVESEDFYIGKEIKVSLKGLSALPSVDKVEELITHNANPSNKPKKVNLASAMMINALDEFNQVNKDDRAKWIATKTEQTIEAKRKLELDVAKEKFAVIVGQVWFPEFKSMDENTLDITTPLTKEKISCSVVLKEIEVKI